MGFFSSIYSSCEVDKIDNYAIKQEEINEITDQIEFDLHRKISKSLKLIENKLESVTSLVYIFFTIK